MADRDPVVVTDGLGGLAQCVVAGERDGLVVAELVAKTEQRPLSPAVAVYQAGGKGAKLDEVVDRVAELGVAELCAFESRRTVVKWDAAKRARLAERWAHVARSAAKQARNPWVLVTGEPVGWSEMVRRVAAEPLALVLWAEAALPLRAALSDRSARIALVVGPEGGFTRAECEELARVGAQLVSLGPRILRTEVAPVVAASVLLWHYGLIG